MRSNEHGNDDEQQDSYTKYHVMFPLKAVEGLVVSHQRSDKKEYNDNDEEPKS